MVGCPFSFGVLHMQLTATQSSPNTLGSLGLEPNSCFGGIVCTSSSGESINREGGKLVTIIGFPSGIDCKRPSPHFEKIVARFKEKAPSTSVVEVKKEGGRVFIEAIVRVYSLNNMVELRNLLLFIMQEELQVNFTT